MGDSQHVMYAAMDVERGVLDTIVGTSATTIAGAVALLEFWSEIRKSSPEILDDDQIDTLISSVADVLRVLPPNITVIA
jgi:hypothetical protein